MECRITPDSRPTVNGKSGIRWGYHLTEEAGRDSPASSGKIFKPFRSRNRSTARWGQRALPTLVSGRARCPQRAVVARHVDARGAGHRLSKVTIVCFSTLAWVFCTSPEQSSNQLGVPGNQVAPESVDVTSQRPFPSLVGSIHQFELHTQVLQCHNQNVTFLQPPQLALAQFPPICLLNLLHATHLKTRPSHLFNPSRDNFVTFQAICTCYI